MRQKIILDCDPGHDDAIAILLAARHPAVELLAITTVAGNQSVDKTSHNALKVCSLARIDNIPIAKGCSRPLTRPPRFAPNIHGESGLDGPQIPEPSLELVSLHAVDLLIELLLQSDGDITIIATGPLTNIATAMRKEPAIVPKICAISFMGGAIGLGNMHPAAEFNIWCDPEAAAIVFESGCRMTMVPLEVTHRALASERIVQQLYDAGRTVTSFAADLLIFFKQTYRDVFGFSDPPVHDPCAVVAVIEPEIVLAASMYVTIELTGTWTSGRTVCDPYRMLGKPSNMRVGYDLDVPRFWKTVIDTLCLYE